MKIQIRMIPVAASLVLFACGARPGMDPLLDGGAGADAESVMSDAVVATPDAYVVPEPCDWVAGHVFQLTEPPNDKRLHSVAVTDRGALVAWQISNSPADNTRRLQRVTWLGEPDWPAGTLFASPGGGSYGGVRLAAGPEHYGATVWDEANGCRFRPIDELGTALGTPHQVATTNCGSLRSTPGGFSFLTRSYSAVPATLVRLDAQGQRILESDPFVVLTGDVFWYATVMLTNGDYVAAGLRDGVAPMEIRTQRLDPDGVPQTDPETIYDPGVEVSRVRLIQTPDGILAGWLESEDTAPSYQHRRIVLQPLDLDGRLAGPAVRLPERYAYRDSSWSVTLTDGQLLVGFVEPLESDSFGDLTAAIVQPVTFAGQPDGPAVELTRQRFLRDTLVRGTPLGTIMVFQASGADQLPPHQIFAGAVVCERPE
jgi:hypothetical protein